MRKKLILDCDTGTDDAVAIMLAALHPDLDLQAVTTVNGNNPVEYCTENTLRVLDLLGSSVPVYAGLSRPLIRPDFPPSETRVKRGGPGDVHGLELDLPRATSKPQDASAVEFLIDTYMNTTEEIALVPVGPLSNIAAAIALEPRIVDNIPEVVLMGGGFTTGNVTPSAEFNVWADPEASYSVFNAGFRKLTVVPLDATHTAGLVSGANCDELEAAGNPAAAAVAAFVRKRIEGYAIFQPMDQQDTAPVHDALAVAYLADHRVLNAQPMYTAIELTGTETLGRTVFDPGNRSKRPVNSNVAFTGDAELFWQILRTALIPA